VAVERALVLARPVARAAELRGAEAERRGAERVADVRALSLGETVRLLLVRRRRAAVAARGRRGRRRTRVRARLVGRVRLAQAVAALRLLALAVHGLRLGAALLLAGRRAGIGPRILRVCGPRDEQQTEQRHPEQADRAHRFPFRVVERRRPEAATRVPPEGGRGRANESAALDGRRGECGSGRRGFGAPAA